MSNFMLAEKWVHLTLAKLYVFINLGYHFYSYYYSVLWPPNAKSWLIWKDPWERLMAGVEGDDRGWDGWMASLTWRTWIWVDSGSWWWTGRPGMLQFMGSQRVRHNWVTELTLCSAIQYMHLHISSKYILMWWAKWKENSLHWNMIKFYC